MEALNQKERKFAEEHHTLIYAFLRYYHLPEAEYYDLLAIAYLHAVKDWHSKPELREKYRFSTIAFKKMLSAKIKKYHADLVRDAYIAFSLNDLNAEGNEYLAQFPDPHDRLREAQERQNGRRAKEDEEEMFTLTAQDLHGVIQRQRKELVPPGDTYASALIHSRGLETRKDGISHCVKGGGGGSGANFLVEKVGTPRAVKLQNSNMRGRRVKDEEEATFSVTSQDIDGVLVEATEERSTPPKSLKEP